MSTVEKISVALTPDLALLVRKAVENGYYASTSEIVREALRDWKKKQGLEEQRILELRALWQEGIDSDSSGELDMADIKREARQRYETEHVILKK
jgi:antitoxin ParD1/3/4